MPNQLQCAGNNSVVKTGQPVALINDWNFNLKFIDTISHFLYVPSSWFLRSKQSHAESLEENGQFSRNVISLTQISSQCLDCETGFTTKVVTLFIVQVSSEARHIFWLVMITLKWQCIGSKKIFSLQGVLKKKLYNSLHAFLTARNRKMVSLLQVKVEIITIHQRSWRRKTKFTKWW